MSAIETIYALSSAPGRAGVAVVRLSGTHAGAAYERLTGHGVPEPRRAVLVRLRDGGGETIDRALALWFAAPASFTGEDVAEFHVHGGRAVIEALLEALGREPGLRLAEPGEFTRRAVENGKFDLSAAEGLADLIDAETVSQRRQALAQQGGALARAVEDWRARLVAALAYAEAGIDFAEEELGEDVAAAARRAIELIASEMQTQLDESHRGELVREGLAIAIVGQPNAGKSTLVNALARREVAIVAESAGTTRDIIEVRLNLGGYAVTLADTAGLRDAAEAVEAEGVRRALARAEAADLVLLLLDASAEEPYADLPPELIDRADLTVWNKADVAMPPYPPPGEEFDRPYPGEGHGDGPEDAGIAAISAKTGEALPELIAQLTALVKARLEGGGGEAPVLTRARHRQAVEQAVTALRRAAEAIEPELMAEDLRLAARALGRITGRVDVEDLLDVIFRDFCIGK